MGGNDMGNLLRDIAQKAVDKKIEELKKLLKVAGRKHEKEVSSYLSYLYETPNIIMKTSIEDVIDLIHLALLKSKSNHKMSIDRITKDIITIRGGSDDFYKKEMVRIYQEMSGILGDDSEEDDDSDDESSDDGEAEPPYDVKKIIKEKIETLQKQKEIKKKENKDMRQIFSQAQAVWGACGFQGKAPKDFVFALRPKLRDFGYDAIIECADMFLSRKNVGMGWKVFVSQIPSLVTLVKIKRNPALNAKKELVEKLYNGITARNDRVTEEFYIPLYYTPYSLLKAKIDDIRRIEDIKFLPKLTTIIERAFKEFKAMDEQKRKQMVEQSKQVIQEDIKKFKINIAYKPPSPTQQEDGGSNPPLPQNNNGDGGFFKKENKEDKNMHEHKVTSSEQSVYKRKFAPASSPAPVSTSTTPAPTSTPITAPSDNNDYTIIVDMQNKMVNKLSGVDVNDKIDGVPAKSMRWAKSAISKLLKEFVTDKNEKIDREKVMRLLRKLAIVMGLGIESESDTRATLLSLLNALSTANTIEWWEEIKDKLLFKMLTAKDYDELAQDVFSALDILKNESDKELVEDKHFAQVVFVLILNSLSRYLMFKKIPPIQPQQQNNKNDNWEERKKKIDEYKEILHSLKTPEEKWEFVMKVLQGGIKSADDVLRR